MKRCQTVNFLLALIILFRASKLDFFEKQNIRFVYLTVYNSVISIIIYSLQYIQHNIILLNFRVSWIAAGSAM